MEIPSFSSPITRALSTPNSDLRPQANPTTEEPNNSVGTSIDRVDQTQGIIGSRQDVVQGVTTDLNAQQTTRNNLETNAVANTSTTEEISNNDSAQVTLQRRIESLSSPEREQAPIVDIRV